VREWFRRLAHRSADVVGSPWVFFLALVIVIAWAATAPMFGYSAPPPVRCRAHQYENFLWTTQELRSWED